MSEDTSARDPDPASAAEDLQSLLGPEGTRRDAPFPLPPGPGGAGSWWVCPRNDHRERAYPDGLRGGGRCPQHNMLLEPEGAEPPDARAGAQ